MVERIISSFDSDPLSVPAYMGPASTRCYYPNFAANAKQLQSYSWHQAMDDMVNPILTLANGTASGGAAEVGSGAAITQTVSIEWPLGTFNQCKFSGSAAGGIANLTERDTDPTVKANGSDLTIPRGSWFRMHTFITTTGTQIPCFAGLTGVKTGDFLAIAASGLTDATMTGTPNGSRINGYFAPPAKIKSTTTRRSFGCIGDSRMIGLTEGNDDVVATGETGEVTPSIGEFAAWLNYATGSATAANFIARNPRRIPLLRDCTDIIGQLGINDMGTADALVTAITGIIAQFPGQRVWWCTIHPRATSTNGFIDLAAQTVDGNNGERVKFNNYLRTGKIPGLAGFIENADVVECGRDSGKLIPNPAANFYVDTIGLHLLTNGNQLIKKARVIRPEMFRSRSVAA